MVTMMKCGHAANGVETQTGKPVCVICVGIGRSDDATTPAPEPDLTGREMRCGYDHGAGCSRRGGKSSVVPSDAGAAFFEHKGDGSPWAARCRNCNCTPEQHADGTAHNRRVPCTDYEPVGPAPFDAYYCGCYGWD